MTIRSTLEGEPAVLANTLRLLATEGPVSRRIPVRDWTPNEWGGFDLVVDFGTGNTGGEPSGLLQQFLLRLVREDEGYYTLIAFTDARRGIVDFKVKFDGVATERLIAAAIREAVIAW